jgi:hypothetical protein
MRMLKMWKWTAALALAAYASSASAESLFRWTAEDGSVSFTDDAKRIPARYRSAAQAIQIGGLSGYKQYSPTKTESQAKYVEQLEARLERLRALNRRLDDEAAIPYMAAAAGPAMSPGGGQDAYVRVGRDLTVRVPNAGPDEAPVIVDDVRVRRSGEIATVHDTIISQGGRVLMVVRGDPHLFDVSAREIVDESEIISRDELIGE